MSTFKIKDMDIATGGPLVAIVNEHDAKRLDLHYGDRIGIYFRRKKAIAIVDLGESKKAVPKGRIGLFEEVLDKLNVKRNDTVAVKIENKPRSVHYIKRKLYGYRLKEDEIREIIEDITDNKLSDIELAYFVSACHGNLMTMDETVALTKAMVDSGDVLKLKTKQVVDKHCVGGVAGNRTTLVVVPIVAAAGLIVPKTSSRSITSPAGTADTMEVLSRVCFSINDMKRIIKKTNACMVWGGAINLAPADDKLIRVEHPLAIDSRSQLLASVIAKKASVSATHVLVDIPTGKGAKIETIQDALKLKKQFEEIGKKIGIKFKAIITDGSQPIGNGLGPALEARDVLWLFRNDKRAPYDLREKSLYMAGLIFEMTGKAKKGSGRKLAEDILKSGRAYKKFMQIIKAQKGKEITPDKIRIGRFKKDIKAGKTGIVTHVDNHVISRVARLAGAPLDKEAGIYLYKHKKDRVRKGERLFTIYSNSKARLGFAERVYNEEKGILIS